MSLHSIPHVLLYAIVFLFLLLIIYQNLDWKEDVSGEMRIKKSHPKGNEMLSPEREKAVDVLILEK